MNETVATSDGLVTLPVITEMAETYKLTAKAFAFTFRAVAMPQPHTEAEFVSCCLVAREHGLNPLTKEIYFMRTRAGQIQPIVSVDGWIKKCNEHPQFDGLEFSDEREDDGKLVSMTVAIYRKDRSRPTRVTEYMSECKANGGPVWKTAENRMLRNRTLCQGARIAFGFAGIMETDEFEQWQRMKDVTPRAPMAAANDLPDIPDFSDIPDGVDAMPEIPTTAFDPAKFLDQLDGVLSACKDIDSLNESWDMNEAAFDGLDIDKKEEAYAIFNKHEKRIEAAA